MSGYLAQVTNVVQQVGQRIVISGVEKAGKTTLASAAPNALLIPLEQGSGTIPVAKTPMLQTWEEVEALCLELIAAAKAGRIQRGSSVVWDSATALEKIIHAYLIRKAPEFSKFGDKLTMEVAYEGYGKAYAIANSLFDRWTRYMDELAFYGGINIIVTCHVFASRVTDPAHGEYDTWDLLLHSPKNNKTYGKREMITQWADGIFFLHEPMFVIEKKDAKVIMGQSLNQGRMLAVDRQPAWVAGNRYGLTGLIAIPKPDAGAIAINSWNTLAHSIYEASRIDLWNRG